MEPLAFLESRHKIDAKKCVICQTFLKNENLSESGEVGSKTLIGAAMRRQNLKDSKNADKIERILDEQNYGGKFLYHRSCYRDFANESKIRRLECQPEDRAAVKKLRLDEAFGSRVLRSNPEARTDKMLCIICQV